MYLLQLALHHNQLQVTALIVLSLHAKEYKYPISHWQVAQHCAQIQGHDQVNPEIVSVNGDTIQRPLPALYQSGFS